MSSVTIAPKTPTRAAFSARVRFRHRAPRTSNRLPRTIAARIAAALDYCGVMGVEFFVMPQDSARPLLVNEIAPRVHNSGHWTIEACAISQFENHIRAIAGWPLGSAARHSDAIMTNLHRRRGARLALPFSKKIQALSLYLYGKSDIREGRKLGHVTQISPLKRMRTTQSLITRKWTIAHPGCYICLRKSLHVLRAFLFVPANRKKEPACKSTSVTTMSTRR